MMSRPQPPAGFVTIGSGIYISLPRINAATLQPNDSAPNIILIFGWMGALTRHLQSYSRKYTELYPHATQIIIKCAPSFFWTSTRAHYKRLIPVVEALESFGCLPESNNSARESARVRPRVLVHSFSNGGGLQLTTLSHLLTLKYPSVPPSEYLVSAIIIDSSPAFGGFRTIGKAFSVAIRNSIVRYIAIVFLYLVHALRLSLHIVFGVETVTTQYFKMLLRPRLLPWLDPQTPRLYIFSKKDQLVPWQEVEQHVNTARLSGLNVRREVYEESAHVDHMRLDPKRYWASVQDVWQIACRESPVRVDGDA